MDFYKRNHNFEGTFDECYSEHGNDWNGGRWRKNENGIWCDYSTYNPNSKWDWYSVGGRWSGFFRMKPGKEIQVGEPGVFGNHPKKGHSDIALKKDIDFEGMKIDAENEALENYDKIIGIIGDLPESESWESVRERFGDDMESAREFYHNQPRNKALTDAGEHWVNPEDYQISREEYGLNARNGAISTYAVVKDGEWYQKGEMGWWGMSSNEISQNEWNEKFNELIESCDDDEIFTLVDCHI